MAVAGAGCTDVPRDAVFEAAALACLPELLRFARALTHDDDAAADLVQETYVRAYHGYATFLPGADMRRWLFTICHHAWVRLVHRERRVILTPEGESAELETLAAVHDHADSRRSGGEISLDTLDLGPAIDRALATLTPDARSVVLLVDVEGLSYEHAAEVLEVPVGTVRSRLFRARRLLQAQLLSFARDAGLVGDRPLPTNDPRTP